MTKKLQVLQQSLAKKETRFELKLNEHFATVKQANGQPLNDKRNGQATLKKWERQDQALHKLNLSIEKTKEAIDIEESKIRAANNVKDQLPQAIVDLIDEGILKQWRKYPHMFFVDGVDKAVVSQKLR